MQIERPLCNFSEVDVDLLPGIGIIHIFNFPHLTIRAKTVLLMTVSPICIKVPGYKINA